MKYYHYAAQLLNQSMKPVNVSSGTIAAANHQNVTDAQQYVLSMMAQLADDMKLSEFRIHIQRLSLVEQDDLEPELPQEVDEDLDDFNF